MLRKFIFSSEALVHQHSYTAVVTAPTCTQDGYTTYTCSMCGNSYTDSETAAAGHGMTYAVLDGQLYHICTNCDHRAPACSVTQDGQTVSVQLDSELIQTWIWAALYEPSGRMAEVLSAEVTDPATDLTFRTSVQNGTVKVLFLTVDFSPGLNSVTLETK